MNNRITSFWNLEPECSIFFATEKTLQFLASCFSATVWLNVITVKGCTASWGRKIISCVLSAMCWSWHFIARYYSLDDAADFIIFIYLVSPFVWCLILTHGGILWTDRLNLRPAKEYRYLNQSSCMAIDKVDDAKQFEVLRVRLVFCMTSSYVLGFVHHVLEISVY